MGSISTNIFENQMVHLHADPTNFMVPQHDGQKSQEAITLIWSEWSANFCQNCQLGLNPQI